MPEEAQLQEIRQELREIRNLLETPAPRPDDLVGADYVAQRTGLAVRTILEGKAGTKAIPRVLLREEGSAKRSLIRFQRADVDNWIRRHITEAHARQPQQRALRLLRRK